MHVLILAGCIVYLLGRFALRERDLVMLYTTETFSLGHINAVKKMYFRSLAACDDDDDDG